MSRSFLVDSLIQKHSRSSSTTSSTTASVSRNNNSSGEISDPRVMMGLCLPSTPPCVLTGYSSTDSSSNNYLLFAAAAAAAAAVNSAAHQPLPVLPPSHPGGYRTMYPGSMVNTGSPHGQFSIPGHPWLSCLPSSSSLFRSVSLCL
jgi:hypothetical protein